MACISGDICIPAVGSAASADFYILCDALPSLQRDTSDYEEEEELRQAS